MKVAVIGAGLAGLAAADAVARAGHEPVVLEARDRVGGRVHSPTLPNGAVIEMGAEFVLPGCTEVHAAAERFGLGFWDKGMRYGRREPRGAAVPAGALDAAVVAIDTALKADPAAAAGESVVAFLGRIEIDPGAREAILARAEVSAAAPGTEVPAAELGLLARVSDDPAPTIAGGNQRLAEAFAASLPPQTLRLRAPVRAIAAAPDGVSIRTDDGELAADRCVIALPQPLVSGLTFEPGLPADVADALASVRWGHAAKLFAPLPAGPAPSATLAVPERYWAWTATGDGDLPQPVVSAFSGSAPALERLGVAAGPERWLESLRMLRPDLEPDAAGVVLSDWDTEEYTRGAYSVSIGEAALELLRAPFGPGETLILAGEYLGGEMAALMEGAIRSGSAAAASLLGPRA